MGPLYVCPPAILTFHSALWHCVTAVTLYIDSTASLQPKRDSHNSCISAHLTQLKPSSTSLDSITFYCRNWRSESLELEGGEGEARGRRVMRALMGRRPGCHNLSLGLKACILTFLFWDVWKQIDASLTPIEPTSHQSRLQSDFLRLASHILRPALRNAHFRRLAS